LPAHNEISSFAFRHPQHGLNVQTRFRGPNSTCLIQPRAAKSQDQVRGKCLPGMSTSKVRPGSAGLVDGPFSVTSAEYGHFFAKPTRTRPRSAGNRRTPPPASPPRATVAPPRERSWRRPTSAPARRTVDNPRVASVSRIEFSLDSKPYVMYNTARTVYNPRVASPHR